MNGENTLYSHPAGNLPDGECSGSSTTFPLDTNATELLDTLLIAFDDPNVYCYRITGLKFRGSFLQVLCFKQLYQLFHDFFLDGLQN